jgi:hypothetical protein
MDISVLEFASAKRWREHLVPELPHMAVENHIWALQVFCKWAKMNPDELILERQEEMAARPKNEKPVSSDRITSYQLADKSKTRRSKEFIVKAVASFYENNHSSIDQITTNVR